MISFLPLNQNNSALVRMFRLCLFVLVVISTSCSKEFINPYDPATRKDEWMPRDFRLDTLGINSLHLHWQQDNRHIDGYVLQKYTNGALKEYLVFRDTIDFIDSNAVEANIEATCPEIRYEVLARAGRNRSLAAGMQTPIYMPLSTPAYAGEDIMVIDTANSVQLNAQPTLPGESSRWTIVSGTGGAFENDRLHNTRFTGTPCNAYILRWTKQGCTETYDELNVAFYPSYTTANAGSNQSFSDATTQTTLNANQPATGQTGIWTVVSGEGGVFADASSPTTQFTGQSCTAYVLKWSLSGNCFSSDDDVNINFIKATTTSNAGSNQTITTDVTTVTLTANTPASSETGSWSIISGTGGSFSNTNSPNTTFTGNACTSYTLRWTIQGPCSNTSDNVTIGFAQSTTTANAGANQTITNSATTVILAANTPAAGETGTWSIISGTGGSFFNINSPNATFTGNACTTYTLRWTIQGPCSNTSDDVTIGFAQSTTAANAGVDQTITTSATSVTLAANGPASGESGTWSILSGSGGSFSNTSAANATFTGNACTSYTLRWTLLSPCSTSTNDVNITFQYSATANAGPDQSPTYSNLVTLASNAPANGATGMWSVISGTGGSFSNPNAFNSQFTGILNQSYTLRWTVTACNLSADDVIITFPEGMPGGGVTDIDGNVYSTTIIGTQEWMGRNLKVSRFSDGSFIAEESPPYSWNITTPVYGYYNGASADDATVYGKLYNWYAATDSRNLCPTGWHVPSKAEWDILFNYLGSNGGVGKLKSTFYWDPPNTGATNAVGFNAVPCGYNTQYGTDLERGITGWYLSTTQDSNNSINAEIERMYYNSVNRSNTQNTKKGGYSIRCVKN
jgi:uncharacterized protein (TIGR02145 family)